MKTIITCDLPLPIQKLYIKRLKHMILKYEYDNFCGHCPFARHFSGRGEIITQFRPFHRNAFDSKICNFCATNVGVSYQDFCPCRKLNPKEALKRAKDFIERFEAREDERHKVG